MAPGIVRHVGDVGDLAALVIPRRVVVARGVAGTGMPLGLEQLGEAYKAAHHTCDLLDARRALTLLENASPAEVVEALR
jgi:hypothetical protein